jgi:2-keto-3-deoxy-L-arabinonate dehydratase
MTVLPGTMLPGTVRPGTGLSGLVPILATPFRSDGSLDLPSLARLVEFQVASGAAGVATFGLASETFTLSAQERRLVLDTVVRTARTASDPLPVVAGIAATGLYPAVEQGKEAADGGATVLMVLPPFLVRPGDDQLAEFFGELAAAVGVPVMMQDAPALTGVPMSVRVIAETGQLPGVDYVKIEAAPTAPKVAAVASAVAGLAVSTAASAAGSTVAGGKLRVFGGQNAQFLLDELDRGAIGTMPACEFTDLLAPVMTAWDAGRRDEAEARFYRLLPLLVYGLQSGIAWAVHKEVLVRRGIIADARVRAPARPLDAASAAGLLRLLRPLEREPGWKPRLGTASEAH